MLPTYPSIPAGTLPTSLLLQRMLPLTAYKSGDQSVVNSTTLVNDAALVVPVEANAVYKVELFIYYAGDSAADLKVNFTFPSGATSNGTRYLGLNTSLAIQYGEVVWGGALAFGANGAGTIEVAELAFTLATSATAGNLQLQIAQNTATATAITVKAGSLLTAKRHV